MGGGVCDHIKAIKDVKQAKKRECEECVKIGSRWVHLRTCQECGVTLCCDNSPNRHATKHARATHGRGANLRREAHGWLVADDRADVFSFGGICDTLGIDAGRLRRRVLTEARAGAPQPA